MNVLSSLRDCLRCRRAASAGDDPDDGRHESWDLFFGLNTLQAATDFFSELNKLGHGGFGPVYKVILSAFWTSDFCPSRSPACEIESSNVLLFKFKM